MLENMQKSDSEDLRKKLKEKSFLERHYSEPQTKIVPIRGQKPEKEDGEEGMKPKTRGEVFRFERGQILKAYKIMRNQIEDARKKRENVTDKKNFLKEIHAEAKILERNLDKLNLQYYENVKTIDIETEYGKFSVPMAELDLRNKESDETKEDDRTPYVLLGTVGSSYHNTASLSMGLALSGKKVLIPAWPEQEMVGRPENFAELLKKQTDLKLHKEYIKQLMRALGLKKVNIIGVSMGGAVALELACDEDFKEIQDLIIIEPPSLEEKSYFDMIKDFGIKEGLINTLPYSEERIKAFNQGSKDKNKGKSFLIDDGKILAKQQFDFEKLSKINPNGRYQLWVGTKSSITDYKQAEKVFGRAESLRKFKEDKISPLEIHLVEGGSHSWPFVNSVGFAKILDEKNFKEQVSTVKLTDLENSGMDAILKGLESKK